MRHPAPLVVRFPVARLGEVYSTEFDTPLAPDMGLRPEHIAAAGSGPIDLLTTPEGELLIRDGHHRAVRAMQRGDSFIAARIHRHVVGPDGEIDWPTAPIPV